MKKSWDKSISFVKEGEVGKKKNSGLQPGLLDSATDWEMLVDKGKQLVFPNHIVVTKLRPDIVVFSNKSRAVILIELTCPREENFEDSHARKLDSYAELQLLCKRNGWKPHLFAVEVGARGYAAKSLGYCLRRLGLTNRDSRGVGQRAADAALRSSFRIWLKRDCKEWDGNGGGRSRGFTGGNRADKGESQTGEPSSKDVGDAVKKPVVVVNKHGKI